MTWVHGANGGMSRDKLGWVQRVEGREFLAKQTRAQTSDNDCEIESECGVFLQEEC